jgi:hypothetical protein
MVHFSECGLILLYGQLLIIQPQGIRARLTGSITNIKTNENIEKVVKPQFPKESGARLGHLKLF